MSEGVQRVLERVLVSPEFLFRIEREPDGLAPDTAYAVTDLELASRLSFFLWSSIPGRRADRRRHPRRVCGTRRRSTTRSGGCWPIPEQTLW